jgi:hypothetical protein
VGAQKIKNEKIFLFCGFCSRKSVEPLPAQGRKFFGEWLDG